MVFSHRIAALAAVVAIPLGIAVTSYALTDRPEDRKVPSKVELESGAPGSPSSPPPVPTDETIPPPRMSEGTSADPSRGSSADPSQKPSGTSGTTPPASPKPPAGGGDDDDNGQGDDGPGGDDFGDDG
ncbi:small secreted hydrophilic protein [Streptomyces sp. CAU 1734]|uniref:small secreted hydrophilic protein n=1 Tax=Streptomyces sp. CAU 1734 TaxID=3140360 RepID=UPI0032613DA2